MVWVTNTRTATSRPATGPKGYANTAPLPAPAVLLLLLLAAVSLAGPLVIDVLDVGQGDAILLRAAGKAVLVDGGPSDAGTLAQLRRLGVERLDLVVATHPHADHVGGLTEVVRALPVGLFVDNGQPHSTRTYARLMEAVEARRIRYRTARRGLRFRMGDEVTLTVLAPPRPPLRGTRSDLNANSVVLWVDHGDVDLLLLGDAEAPTEAILDLPGEVDVLKVAHHGSAWSSTTALLARARPRYAIVSAGRDNPYGHPAAEALQRLRQAGAMVYRTDRSGHLRVISDGRDVEVLEGTLGEILEVPIVQAVDPALSEGRAPRR